jgi:hypothetical protein
VSCNFLFAKRDWGLGKWKAGEGSGGEEGEGKGCEVGALGGSFKKRSEKLDRRSHVVGAYRGGGFVDGGARRVEDSRR